VRASSHADQDKFSMIGVVPDLMEPAHGIKGAVIAIPYARPDFSPPPVKKKKKK
jgi:hypothetical protein